MSADIAGDFATARRVADVDCFLQVELFDQRLEVVRVGIHIVALPGLARPAMPAAVVSNAAVTARSQEEHLVFEGIRAQRPPVAENNRLT